MRQAMVAMVAMVWAWSGAIGQEENGTPAEPQVAYLGVSTSPLPAVLKVQLALQYGLAVDYVNGESPAGQVLQRADVLRTLNDQLLFNHEQLAGLIRMRRPGEEVALTLLRAGEPMTVRVVLGGRDAGGRDELLLGTPGIRMAPPAIQPFRPGRRPVRSPWDGATAQPVRPMRREPEPAAPAAAGDEPALDGHATGTYTSVAPDGTVASLVINRGRKQLLVKDRGGEVVFDGPVDDEGQRARVPGRYRDRLKRLEEDAAAIHTEAIPDGRMVAPEDEVPL